MADAFTTLWSRDRYVAARKHAPPKFRFDLLFGGPHLSLPSFLRAGARPGDWVYPIHVHSGALHLLGRMRIAQLLTEAEFRSKFPDRADGIGRFNLAVGGNVTSGGPRTQILYLASSCVDEVVIGTEGTPFFFDLTVPGQTVEALRFVSRRGERGMKHVEEGRIKSIVSLQGIYRLATQSSQALGSLVEERLSHANL